MAERAAAIHAFLAAAGWGAAARAPLAGDASARRYERLRQGAKTAVLMDAPPLPGGDRVEDFDRIARHLRGIGLAAPEVLAADLPAGLMLLEDLGDDLYARVLRQAPEQEVPLYLSATEVLAHLQAAPAPTALPDLSAADWAAAAGLVFETYAADAPRAGAAAAREVLAEALARHACGPRVLILRDFHAENLLWLPDREGRARVGLLDFQLAQMGQPGYDVVSLTQDARRDVLPATEAAVLRHFADLTGRPLAALEAAQGVLGTQRALRILGVFARLAKRDGKAGYLPLMPRVWGHLQRNLARPELADLCRRLTPLLPPPTAAHLQRFGVPCPMP
jgi:aminoglycoside/choline kinase family phosphotransferase